MAKTLSKSDFDLDRKLFKTKTRRSLYICLFVCIVNARALDFLLLRAHPKTPHRGFLHKSFRDNFCIDIFYPSKTQ